ncbi:DUF6273 domain-containing protein [Clostridium sp. E02]|uniref:DUF6273 domain-containing protein n=1 Tax=Clostridium sp. E02 TaxID=2487134 RepID=UPI000F54516D|nr:DUF6273 domain-containing protein [Clostridium sp. E02]
MLLGAVLTASSIPFSGYGAWIQKDMNWFYEENWVYEKNTWKEIEGSWYYFDQTGYMVTGWKLINNRWYFFNPISDGTKGKMLTGWQWIDGHCYYLAGILDSHYPEGAMYSDTMTPDGFQVNSSGAWSDKDGKVQYTDGKGIQTITTTIRSVNKFFLGGSGGGGGSRHSSRHRSGHKSNESKNRDNTKVDVSTPSDAQSADKNSGSKVEEYSYTIRYLNAANKTVLQIVTGKETKNTEIIIDNPNTEGYKICKNQKESFLLSKNGMTITIYLKMDSDCATPSEATPSQAKKKVSWKVYFVEEDDHRNQILKSQHGKTEEGLELVIDYPDTIAGADGYYYYSTLPSPWTTEVYGSGTQKYYIEFEKGNKIPTKDDPDQESKDKLSKWLETISSWDFEITGRKPTDSQIITDSREGSNERILNLVSMAKGSDRKELYLVAKGYIPNSVIIGQTFDDVTNVSNLIMDEFIIDGKTYTVMRVGFEKIYDEETCNHDYEVIERVEPTSTEDGYEIVRCRNCGKEETIILPATSQAGDTHYNIGDVQARTIGDKIYLFRCIDDDFEDALGNNKQTALFLCDSVIRSDIDGTGSKRSFGEINNYKYSNVREWLKEHALDRRFAQDTYIGITKSYIGATKKGTYEQFLDSSLMGFDRLYQSMEDKVFLLSVEEANKYRDYLWKFNGSEENNSESQISAYSKGYYLRTPQDNGRDKFQYGKGIYSVSLVDGNIKPVDVRETSIGIRPVMAVPQG